MEATLELLKLGFVGLVAGFFSSMLANRNHRQQKWWELRVTAYQNTIDALSDLVHYFDRHYSATIRSAELNKEFEKKLEKQWDESFPKVRKAADSGAFLFSDEANRALRTFVDDKEEHHSYFDYLDSNLALAKKCLTKLVECSRRDLTLRARWLDRVP